MVCLELKFYKKFNDLPLKRRWCLDIWEKINPLMDNSRGSFREDLRLIDSLWFFSKKERTKYIEERYKLK